MVDVLPRIPYTKYSVVVQLCCSSLPSSPSDSEPAKGRLETGTTRSVLSKNLNDRSKLQA